MTMMTIAKLDCRSMSHLRKKLIQLPPKTWVQAPLMRTRRARANKTRPNLETRFRSSNLNRDWVRADLTKPRKRENSPKKHTKGISNSRSKTRAKISPIDTKRSRVNSVRLDLEQVRALERLRAE